MTDDSLLEFPCDFPMKVMGRMQTAFAQDVVAIVKRRVPAFDESSITIRPSSKKTYVGLTFLVHVTSREQLDELYKELCDHPQVVMVL